MIDLSKYKRIFTFGCSFTHWYYPTWANVVHQCAPDITMINLGQGGGGNSFIANRMTQANRTYTFCDTDLVMVMWSTLCREDRYYDLRWRTVGNVFSQSEYDKKFVKKFCDPIGYLIKDLSTIDLATSYMKNLPCDYFDMLSVPFNYQIIDEESDIYKDVMHTYRDLISHFPAPMYELMGSFFGKLTYMNNGEVMEDFHPNSQTYCDYLQKIGFPITPAAVSYAEEAHSKAQTVKDSSWFVRTFPEIQHASSNYYTYQHQWKIK